ncbi:MAG TPA: thiamine biosynthesis protein ThiF [Myxococcales bacterium]|nr:thiamine biosynthesis protein ThiF [Myxococcales bacterium]
MEVWTDKPVAIIGCGGLGAPAAWTLALAGARRLRLIDPDVVELSNLHRQVLFAEADVAQPKVDVLAKRLKRRFDTLQIEVLRIAIDEFNVDEAISGCVGVFEGSDDAQCKFIVSDALVRARHGTLLLPTTGVIAAAISRRTQWMTMTAQSACYRCLFEEPPPAQSLATCETAGVLGPVVGIGGAAAAASLIDAFLCTPSIHESVLVQRNRGQWRKTFVARATDCCCSSHFA